MSFIIKNRVLLLIIFLILFFNVPILAFAYRSYREANLLKVQVHSFSGEKEQGKSSLAGESEERVYVPVVAVIDGDTIEVNINGKLEQVRFLGINTPEITPGVECFGVEVTERVKELFLDKKVFLLADLQNTDRDPYNRLLRYVYLPDNRQVNKILLEEGYARYYSHFPIAYGSLYEKLEKEAKEKGVGMWAICNM